MDYIWYTYGIQCAVTLCMYTNVYIYNRAWSYMDFGWKFFGNFLNDIILLCILVSSHTNSPKYMFFSYMLFKASKRLFFNVQTIFGIKNGHQSHISIFSGATSHYLPHLPTISHKAETC